MQKLVRVTTDLTVTIHDFPEGSYQEKAETLRMLIGHDCNLYQTVRPKRLYTDIEGGKKSLEEGNPILMLVDEEGLLKSLVPNMLGIWLYGVDIYGFSIVGDMLFVGTCCNGMGMDLCGLTEKAAGSLKKELEEKIAKFADKN